MEVIRTNSELPGLMLGTAMWGWTVSRKTAFSLLDTFYDAGYRKLDAATNYPINQKAEDFRAAEQILFEWIRAHGVQDLSVFMKIGSLTNQRSPEHNLKSAFLHYNWRYYQGWLGHNLGGIMVHWDNRGDESDIFATLEVLKAMSDSGLEVGFSGLRYPEIYAQLNRRLQLSFSIQVKHNLMASDYPRYSAFHENAHFWAYGINGGGIKLDATAYHLQSSLSVRGGNKSAVQQLTQSLNNCLAVFNEGSPKRSIRTMNEAAMTFALLSPGLEGILLGPSRVAQLAASLAFYQKLAELDYRDLFAELLTIHRQYAPLDRQI